MNLKFLNQEKAGRNSHKVWYPSKGQQIEVAFGVFPGDDAANQQRGTEAAAEEHALDAVAMAHELNALHQVH